MKTQTTTPVKGTTRALLLLCSIVLLVFFFLTWVSWPVHPMSGADFPRGHFFAISGSVFNLDNPFPEYSFANYLFWLIPAAALASILLSLAGKKTGWASLIAGVLALSLATVYVLFTDTLVLLGGVPSLSAAIKPGLYVTVIAAAGIICAGMRTSFLVKLLLILVGPLAAWGSFKAISHYIENKTFDNTADLKPAYTVKALDLIREFDSNDSAANKKYVNQILLVQGRISELEQPNDSTINLKMTDTTGSYAIFPFYSKSLGQVKNLKQGDSVSIKGACSGDVYSEILETRFISFERCIINKP